MPATFGVAQLGPFDLLVHADRPISLHKLEMEAPPPTKVEAAEVQAMVATASAVARGGGAVTASASATARAANGGRGGTVGEVPGTGEAAELDADGEASVAAVRAPYAADEGPEAQVAAIRHVRAAMVARHEELLQPRVKL
jgi:hypothetical protein